MTKPEAAARTPLRAPPPVEQEAALPTSEELDTDGLPDLRGLGVAAVLSRLGKLGTRLEATGSGVAVEQSPAPGSALTGVVRVTFRPPG